MLKAKHKSFSQGFRGDSINTQVLKKDADGLCRLSQAALCLFEEVREINGNIQALLRTIILSNDWLY